LAGDCLEITLPIIKKLCSSTSLTFGRHCKEAQNLTNFALLTDQKDPEKPDELQRILLLNSTYHF